jgi:hypothetical protein
MSTGRLNIAAILLFVTFCYKSLFTSEPLGAATFQLNNQLPGQLKGSLPIVEQLEMKLNTATAKIGEEATP